MGLERVALYREQAREMEVRASQARTEELRRSYLILARDWSAMADRQSEMLSPPLAPIGALAQLARTLQAETDLATQA